MDKSTRTLTKEEYEEAVQLLRECPSRAAIEHDRYWPWRRRVDDFFARLDREDE